MFLIMGRASSFLVFLDFLFFIFASYTQFFSTISEALFALSFSFLSECFFFVHAKAALAHSLNE